MLKDLLDTYKMNPLITFNFSDDLLQDDYKYVYLVLIIIHGLL